jgi:hypothetical protein
LRHGRGSSSGAFRNITNASACIGAHKSTILVKTLKVANALDRAIVLADGLVILYADPQTDGKFIDATHKHHLSSPSPNLASVTHLDDGGLLLHASFALKFGVVRFVSWRPCCCGGLWLEELLALKYSLTSLFKLRLLLNKLGIDFLWPNRRHVS